MIPRWVHYIYAGVGGYFWKYCERCGLGFGGHQWRHEGQERPTPEGPCSAICAYCPRCRNIY